MSLDELADREPNPGSLMARAIDVEFAKRQAEFYERQARAAEATSTTTATYTRYMFWSVVILAIAAVLNLAVSITGLVVSLATPH